LFGDDVDVFRKELLGIIFLNYTVSLRLYINVMWETGFPKNNLFVELFFRIVYCFARLRRLKELDLRSVVLVVIKKKRAFMPIRNARSDIEFYALKIWHRLNVFWL